MRLMRLQTLSAIAICLATPGLLFPVNFNSPRVYALSHLDPTDITRGVFDAGPLVLGDFNGDGTPDMVVAASLSVGGGLAVFLGRAGVFEHAADLALPAPANSMVAGDFNKDGKLDVAVATATSLSILLGNGDGTFQPAVNYPAGVSPYALATADFRGFGNLDLAVTDFASAAVLILLGNGDGAFQPAVSYPVGIQPGSIAVADFNGDGKLDLAVVNSNFGGTGTVSILYGIGDGAFHRAVNHLVGKSPFTWWWGISTAMEGRIWRWPGSSPTLRFCSRILAEDSCRRSPTMRARIRAGWR